MPGDDPLDQIVGLLELVRIEHHHLSMGAVVVGVRRRVLGIKDKRRPATLLVAELPRDQTQQFPPAALQIARTVAPSREPGGVQQIVTVDEQFPGHVRIIAGPATGADT